eukprot:948801-Heterocapsa_arctica.AAC.1
MEEIPQLTLFANAVRFRSRIRSLFNPIVSLSKFVCPTLLLHLISLPVRLVTSQLVPTVLLIIDKGMPIIILSRKDLQIF